MRRRALGRGTMRRRALGGWRQRGDGAPLPSLSLRKSAAGLLAACAVAACAGEPPGAAAPADWPQRVLVTNDNGIDDVALVELARSLRRDGLEVVVVASREDRSGASNYMTATRAGRYRVERRDLGAGIEAFAVDGEPADCVIFALSGPMRDRPPDLVISGINGGPNLGDDWFGSGTIGAARTAAYFGFPAVAFSGLEDDDPAAVASATRWASEFVRSAIVQSLVAPEYLTVSLPVGPPSAVRGVRLAERARGLVRGRATPAESPESDEEVWSLSLQVDPTGAGPDTDVRTVAEGFIAVVPMRADESDPALRARLYEQRSSLPPWPDLAEGSVADRGAESPAGGVPACDRTLGIVIDDAEEPSGREWGVLVERVEPGGRGERLGLAVGDVVTTLNGADLADDPAVDPDDRFARLYSALGCGETVRLELVRAGGRLTVEFEVGAR